MRHIQIIIICYSLIMMSPGVLAWGSLRSNDVEGLEIAYAPSHDYILQQSYYNLESDPAFKGSNFPSLEDILNNEGLYANTVGSLKGNGPDFDTLDSTHFYNPITEKGGAPLEVSEYYNLLKINLLNNETTAAAKDAAWLAHYIADIAYPFNINGMPTTDVQQNNPLYLSNEVIGYTLPISDSGMGRTTNSLDQNEDPNANLITGIPADAPVRGRGWYDRMAGNWSYEYFHFNDFFIQNNDGNYDWFDPWYYDGTYKYKYKIGNLISLYSKDLFRESSTHILWDWYAYHNYSRPSYPITKTGYSQKFIMLQKSEGDEANGIIQAFADEVALNTKMNQKVILDESISGHDDLGINSSLGKAYQNAICNIYTLWRASFSAIRPYIIIEPSSERDGAELTQKIELKIRNVGEEPATNVRITASTDSLDWNISPETYDVIDAIPAANETFYDFSLIGSTLANSDDFNISFTITGNYHGTPDSGFARISIKIKPNSSIL